MGRTDPGGRRLGGGGEGGRGGGEGEGEGSDGADLGGDDGLAYDDGDDDKDYDDVEHDNHDDHEVDHDDNGDDGGDGHDAVDDDALEDNEDFPSHDRAGGRSLARCISALCLLAPILLGQGEAGVVASLLPRLHQTSTVDQ
ncbi:hypothetical protein CLOP_g2331 [Closterium sp. NIES-67]|nr:hypothetical protein CLOP_g2331 [Closterium sp. NIES-67]